MLDTYAEIVLGFDREGLRLNILKGDIVNMLMVHLEILRPETINRHLVVMQQLGYIKRVRGPGIATEPRYDLVGKKIAELKLRTKAQELVARKKGGAARL